jgi:DHA2 family multidrug resistance protein
MAGYLQSHGYAHADAMHAAYAQIYNQLGAQSHILAFMDCFHLIGIITLVAAPLVLLTRRFKLSGRAPGGH